MTQVSLSAVTLKTVANYRIAAEQAVDAYRLGGHRLIKAAQQGVDLAAQRGAEPYVPGLAAALRRAGDNMGDYAGKGVDAVSDGTERAIVMSANGVSSQVKRVAKLAHGVDNRVVARSLQAAARISLPGAQVALTLSERVAAGADKLAQVAAGPRKAKATTKTATQTTKTAKTATATPSRGVKAKPAPKRAAAKPIGRVMAKAVPDTATEIEVTGQAVQMAAKRRARALETQVGEAVKPAAKPRAAAKRKAGTAKPARSTAVRKSAAVTPAAQDLAVAAA